MKAIPAILLVLGSTFFAHADSDNVSAPRQRLSMDLNWSFTLGDPFGAQNPAFDDHGWRALDDHEVVAEHRHLYKPRRCFVWKDWF